MPDSDEYKDNNTRYGDERAKKFVMETGEQIDEVDNLNSYNYSTDMNERLTKLEVQSEQYKNDISEIKKEMSYLKFWFIGTAISIIGILIGILIPATKTQIDNLEKNTAVQLNSFKENTEIRFQYLNEKYDRLEKQINKNHQEILSKIEEIKK